MKCNYCHLDLESTGGAQYHPRCLKAIWGAKRIPDLPELSKFSKLFDGGQACFYHHHHQRGQRAYLEPKESFDHLEIQALLPQDTLGWDLRLCVNRIASELKISQLKMAYFNPSANETEPRLLVRAWGDLTGVETVIKKHLELDTWDAQVESLSRVIDQHSPTPGIHKTQLFDLALLSYLCEGILLTEILEKPVTINSQKGGWTALDFIVLQGVLGLPPHYFDRSLLRLQKQSKKIAKIVEQSRLKPIRKMELLHSWKDAWTQLQTM